jgi:hypothetical protein
MASVGTARRLAICRRMSQTKKPAEAVFPVALMTGRNQVK